MWHPHSEWGLRKPHVKIIVMQIFDLAVKTPTSYLAASGFLFCLGLPAPASCCNADHCRQPGGLKKLGSYDPYEKHRLNSQIPDPNFGLPATVDI